VKDTAICAYEWVLTGLDGCITFGDEFVGLGIFGLDLAGK
jgi:hypothetical protein